jgi:hypothetical protein
MPWAILATADYPAVRAAIDASLEPSNLSDAVIALDIYAGAAVQDVTDRYPTAAAVVLAATQLKITRAAVYFCAARLAIPVAGVIVSSLSVSARDMNYSRPPYDGHKRAAELLALAEEELDDILEPDEETPNRPRMFTLAPGYRGR